MEHYNDINLKGGGNVVKYKVLYDKSDTANNMNIPNGIPLDGTERTFTSETVSDNAIKMTKLANGIIMMGGAEAGTFNPALTAPNATAFTIRYTGNKVKGIRRSINANGEISSEEPAVSWSNIIKIIQLEM